MSISVELDIVKVCEIILQHNEHDLRLQTCQVNNLIKLFVPFQCDIGKTN